MNHIPIAPKLLKEINVEVHHLSYYVNWDPQENYYAVEKGGFKSIQKAQGAYSL